MADVAWLEPFLGPVLAKALPSLAWLLVVVVAGVVAVAVHSHYKRLNLG